MVKRYISEYLGLDYKGHKNFAFADAYLLKDNKLFIDPCLLERATDPWSKEASACVQSFFDALFSSYRAHDEVAQWRLYSHAHEQNATKLGYGNGYNGKAKTPAGLRRSLLPLSKLACKIETINKAQDLPVFVEGFAEDCLSDLLTNILHEHLYNFTAEQMNHYGCKPNKELGFYTWDASQNDWIFVKRQSWLYNEKELLLVPKWIVRKHFLFKAHQYLYMVVIDRQREQNNWQDLRKRDVWNNMSRDLEHWEYQAIINFTQSHPDALSEYHERLPKYYNRKYGCMSDNELDAEIYKHRVNKKIPRLRKIK